MPKKRGKSKSEESSKQARYRQRAREAKRKLRMLQYRCAARVRLLQKVQGVTENLVRDEELFGEHLSFCPFNEDDPMTIDNCVRHLKNSSSSSSSAADFEESNYEDERDDVNKESSALSRNENLIRKNLKRKLEEYGEIQPDDETPEFTDDEEEYSQRFGNTLDDPTFDEFVNAKKKKIMDSSAVDLDNPQPSTSGITARNVKLNPISTRTKMMENQEGRQPISTTPPTADNQEGCYPISTTPPTADNQEGRQPISTIAASVETRSHHDDIEDDEIFYDCHDDDSLSSHSEIFLERVPIHRDPPNLDFIENQQSEDISDQYDDCDGDPIEISDMIAMPTQDDEDTFYDAQEEFEEDGETDPREDNALLIHGTNLKDFQEALEKESELPTVKERNHSLYARFFFLSSILAVTDRAAKAFWNFARSLCDRKLLSFKAIKKRFEKVIPPVSMTYEFLDTVTKTTHQWSGNKFPRSKFPRPRYILLCEWSTVEMNALYKFFRSVHSNDIKSEFGGKKFVDLFVDGVPLAKSSDCQMNVMCARFLPCRKIWPVAIHVYRKGQSTNIADLCSLTLQECLDNNFVVRKFIGDSPMRAKMKSLKQHNGYCSCEWCYCVGKYLKKEKKMSFDSETMKYKRRTHQEWLEIVSKIENAPESIKEADRYGIKGRSPLLQLNDFDIIRDFVPDPMHNVSLGVGRALMGLILETNKNKEMSTAGGEIAKSFDKLWLQQSIPREFPRMPRSIKNNFKHLKASELIAIICCGFTHFANAMKPFVSNSVVKTWYYFCYIVHAALLPDPVFSQVMPESVAFRKQREFYRLFERNFTKANCSFNLHTFSHLCEIRRIGYLSDFSAIPFESYFSYLKKIIKPYTLSFAKQCLIKSFISNMNEHSCGYKVSISPNGPKRTVNNIIVTRDGLFYHVFGEEGNYFKCNQILTKKFYTPEAIDLDWDYVFVKVMDKVDDEDVLIYKKKVMCKAILADKVLISVPNDVYYT